MNIFYTNENPLMAAQDHCVIHTNKMIIEYAQLLSTAHHVLDGDEAIKGIYCKTHQNHMSAIWARSGQYQYDWVLDCAMALCELYTARTGKIHKTQATLEILQTLPANIKLTDWQDPPVAAPDKFKALAIFNGVAFAYQQYLISKFEEWQQRDKTIKVEFYKRKPSWL